MLYHGSSVRIEGPLKPVLRRGEPERIHAQPAVFATDRKDIAALFMFPTEFLSSIGFEKDSAYICIWGTPEEHAAKDKGGFLYTLPDEHFKKIGKDYEWLSLEEVVPTDVKEFSSAIDGMIECGAQVYFINDDPTFDRIVAEKNDRSAILNGLRSENERRALEL